MKLEDLKWKNLNKSADQIANGISLSIENLLSDNLGAEKEICLALLIHSFDCLLDYEEYKEVIEDFDNLFNKINNLTLTDIK